MATPDAGAASSSTLTPVDSAPALSPILSSAHPAAGSSGSSSTFSTFRERVSAELSALAELLQTRRTSSNPASNDEVGELVEQALSRAGAVKRFQDGQQERWKLEAQHAVLDRCLEELVNTVAVVPADEEAFAHLEEVLDIVLTAFETDYADEVVPLNILEGLMEIRPISACEPLLGYIESRAQRLTKGMEYQRGRGPILLRLLNDLLRRLPRSQSQPVILSGRILLLLSSVYPLGEKSGVNLRGNFNTSKGTVWEAEAAKEMDGAKEEAKKEEEDAKMAEVEEGEEAEPEKDDENAGSSSSFYATFWSLQRYFNNPHLLFVPTPAASTSTTQPTTPLTDLQQGIRRTLSAFAAATKKEKELSGASKEEQGVAPSAEGKDKGGESDLPGEGLEEFFFPKFLTSRNLLDLELADPSFRRQILIQVLILIQYLVSLTPASRAQLASLPVTNQSALPAFIVEGELEAALRDLRSRALDELDAMEGGRKFRKAVQLVLQREQNWTEWKLRSCIPFSKPSVSASELSEKARMKQRALARRPKAFPFKMGNANLARTWERNTTSLDGFEPDVADDELNAVLREYRLEKNRIRQQEQLLARAAPGSAQRADIKAQLESRRTRLQALHWRAIRSASGQQLRFFSQIGAGDVERLEELVDAERREREEREEREAERREASGAKRDGEEVVGKGEGVGEEGEGYDSDSSVLGLTEKKKEDKEKEKEREAGTPEPKDPEDKDKQKEPAQQPTAATTAAPAEEAGTPPPETIKAEPKDDGGDAKMDDAAPTPAAAAAADEPGTPPPATPKKTEDEPGTPPPKNETAPTEPRTPGTPKRPREDEGADETMADGEAAAKRQRTT
ncbi:THO complex subunit THO1/HPR1 [Rhodotorula paludigena]|uniref:THO complex subunit THO1/HPR1 n=1 Tax=Rhodotorula paludigena TaxID=86838 RepID=UPI00317DD653